MFDIFDILVPELAAGAGIAVRPAMRTAFGPTEETLAYVNGMEFARVLSAADAYTNLTAWTGAADRGHWTVLCAHDHANRYADEDDQWRAFLDGLIVILRAHDWWMVTCESDCEQQPLERVRVSADELSDVIDQRRSSRERRIALQATPR